MTQRKEGAMGGGDHDDSGGLTISSDQLKLLAQAGGRTPECNCSATQKLDHFRVEIKAWIPHDHVVDPAEGVRPQKIIPYVLFGSWHSTFRGDDHVGYGHIAPYGPNDEDYRCIAWAEFDFQVGGGGPIFNLKGSGNPTQVQDDIGITHLDWMYVSLLPNQPLATTGTWADQAKGDTWVTQEGSNGITLHLDSGNPLVLDSPPIQSRVVCTIGPTTIAVDYTTTEFPSHGFCVLKNGSEIFRRILLDVSAVDALGYGAAAMLLWKLNHFDNNGTFQAPIDVQSTSTLPP
jgi:hypothetical protein